MPDQLTPAGDAPGWRSACIHYVDSLDDWEAVRTGGVLDYARELKRQGVIGCIGPVQPQPGGGPGGGEQRGHRGADVQRQSLL